MTPEERYARIDATLEALALSDQRFNERLDRMAADDRRLKDRLDALAETVEVMSSMHRELERETAARFADTLQFINQLTRVVEAHEHRIDDLEGQ